MILQQRQKTICSNMFLTMQTTSILAWLVRKEDKSVIKRLSWLREFYDILKEEIQKQQKKMKAIISNKCLHTSRIVTYIKGAYSLSLKLNIVYLQNSTFIINYRLYLYPYFCSRTINSSLYVGGPKNNKPFTER